MAGVTGLEPAASGVTGRHSNQLSYTPKPRIAGLLHTRSTVKQRNLTGSRRPRFPQQFQPKKRPSLGENHP